jgi:hypothetical protein
MAVLACTLIDAYYGWSTCIVYPSEGTYFLTPERSVFLRRARNLHLYHLLPLPGLDTSVCFSLLSFRAVGSLLLLYGMPLKP